MRGRPPATPTPQAPAPAPAASKRGRAPGDPLPVALVRYKPPCGTCEAWRKTVEGEYGRRCFQHPDAGTAGQPIQPGQDACPKYHLAQLFYCPREFRWVFARACAHRHVNSYDDCGGCAVGRAVKGLLP